MKTILLFLLLCISQHICQAVDERAGIHINQTDRLQTGNANSLLINTPTFCKSSAEALLDNCLTARKLRLRKSIR